MTNDGRHGLWRKVGRFRALAPEERRLFMQAVILLPLIGLGLRLLGVRRCRDLLGRVARPSSRAPSAAQLRGVVGRIVRVLDVAARHAPGGDRCLTRSLALWWLLRRKGVETDLRLGARMIDGNLEGHAWVEYRGVPLADDPHVHERYATFVPGSR